MKISSFYSIALALSAVSPTFAHAEPSAPRATEPRAAFVSSHDTLTLAGAELALAAVRAKALGLSVGAAVALVDAGGNLIALERADGTFAAGAMVSFGKARTAALFRKPTSFFEDTIRQGRTPMVALSDFTPLQGGVPIIVRGVLIGAIGVSGASSAAQDELLAITGANALLGALGEQPLTVGAVTPAR